MISKATLDKQLKKIHFDRHGWGRSELNELCNILMPAEEIDECVNGYYEAGFALLVATKERLLLVDKKPLNYLTVLDMRFDTINEFDYSHRFIGAEVKVSAGMKTLHFTSWNQSRLRRLLGFVQYRITEIKTLHQSHQEAQKTHLERMSQQLQMFLAIQQYQYQQQQLAHQLQEAGIPSSTLAALAGAVGGGRSQPSGQSPESGHVSPGQIGVAAMKRVAPVIGAYTRLPWMSERRRYQATT